MEIKALIFDLNGVLVLDKPGYESSDTEKMIFKRLGTTLNEKAEINSILRDLNWNRDHFWEYVGNCWKNALPNLELIEWIDILKKKGYKVALLSNTSGLVFREYHKEFFDRDFETYFDSVIISSEVKMLKPNRDIYEYTLQKLNTRPNETLLIDDSKRYLDSAKLLGINAILFTCNSNLKQELSEFNINF